MIHLCVVGLGPHLRTCSVPTLFQRHDSPLSISPLIFHARLCGRYDGRAGSSRTSIPGAQMDASLFYFSCRCSARNTR